MQKVYCITDLRSKKFKFFTSQKLAKKYANTLESYQFDSFNVTLKLSE